MANVNGIVAGLRIGGLLGAGIDTTITNCNATGSVNGAENVGGLIGHGTGTVTSCYATGSVSGNERVGGLYGMLMAPVVSSFATGTVTGTSEVGGFAGFYGGSITNCQSVQADANATTMTAEQIKSASNLESLGFTEANGWSFDNGNPVHKAYEAPPVAGNGVVSLQIGVNSDTSCQIGFETSFLYNLSSIRIDIASDEALNAIDNFINIFIWISI
jgi:hypothetical protein